MNSTYAKNALVNLNRQADQIWIEEYLTSDPEDVLPLAILAIEVAAEEEGPIGRALASVIRQHGDYCLCRQLKDRIPESTLALRELALAVEQHILATIEKLGPANDTLPYRFRTDSLIGSVVMPVPLRKNH
jgi:hypothetical protein